MLIKGTPKDPKNSKSRQAVQTLSSDLIEAFCASNEFGMMSLDATISNAAWGKSRTARRNTKGTQCPSTIAL